jgi:diketogulonate reductase-like aldo/keto reductase
MAGQPTITLNDGRTIPQLGFGVYQIPPGDVAKVVSEAISTGYRSVDTAAAYHNEEGVGEALQASAWRDEVFVATKLWNERHGYDEALRAFDESLRKLKRDSVDLYLIHWPIARKNKYVDTWKALVRLREEGRAKSIGVSNFTIANLDRIINETGVVPAVNQIELHPRFQQFALRDYHARNSIATESWSPLARGRVFGDPIIARIARKHGKTPAQIVVRWHIDSGLIAIPKSVAPARMRENFDIFDYTLDQTDLREIEQLDDPAGRAGPDPDMADF